MHNFAFIRLICSLLLCILFAGCSQRKRAALQVLPQRELMTQKPRILICSTTGGGAHGSAVKALHSMLDAKYHVAEAFVIRDVLDELDPIKWITGDRLTGEDLYNFFLTHGSAWFANALARYGCHAVTSKNDAMRAVFKDFLKANDPDMVISVMPYINGALLGVCKELRIPFAIVPCDYNGHNYMNGVDLSQEPYDLFRYMVPLNDEIIWYELKKGNIPLPQTPVTGFLVRPEFKKESTKPAETRARFAISSDRPIVFVLMGGAGGNRAYGYVKALMKTKKKMHIVVCVGRNEKLKKRLTRLKMPEKQLLTVVGFTDQIANLMSISDVLITKPGPATIAEALALKVPMVLDVPSRVLYWEEMNINLVKKYKVGTVAHSYAQGARLVTKLLENPQDIPVLAARMETLAVSDASAHIAHIIEELLRAKDVSERS